MPHKDPPDAFEDREQFAHLYMDLHSRIVNSLAQLVRDRTRAEELAADAFNIAWDKRWQFRGESELGTWVHAIGLNHARQALRGSQRDTVHGLDSLERHPEPAVSDVARDLEADREHVLRTLKRLPALSRRMLRDRYLNGQSVEAMARRYKVPVGTVGSRLDAARRLFRQAWEKSPREPAVNDDRLRSITDAALQRLMEELRAGRSETLRAYLAAMSRFHRYSWTNVLLIQAQRPVATRVAGYHTWHDLGRQVRKGEKGIMIHAPVRAKAQGHDGATQHVDDERVVGFRTAYVFDVEQTEGRPLPAFAQASGDPQSFTQKLKDVILARRIGLDYDPTIAPSQGWSSGGSIRLLPNLPAAEEFSTLAHEFAHELLHHNPAARELSKLVRETQAEAVAFVVSRAVGIDSTRAAADYIALYNGDAKTLAESLAVIQWTASTILEDLLPKTREPLSAGDRPGEVDRPRADITRGSDAVERSNGAPERVESPSMER